MRWAALVLALLSAGLLAWTASATLAPTAGPDARFASGDELLRSVSCRPGEERKVVVRGIEDGYSAFGDERAAPHPRLDGLRIERLKARADYDSASPDAEVFDGFEVSGPVASGVVVVRMRPIADNANDAVRIGDFATTAEGVPAEDRRLHVASMNEIEIRGWERSGDLFWASFEDLDLGGPMSLLDHLRETSGSRWLDIAVADDTSVDFIAAVYCVEPATHRGVTFAPMPVWSDPDRRIVAFECRPNEYGDEDCDPITGDQTCKTALPILCWRDLGLPAPDPGGPAPRADMISRRWSGGETAATTPIRGEDVATIDEADRICRSSFGPDWRVAEWHLGGKGWGFSARGELRDYSGRYWIDIRGSPYATCWSRADGD